MQHFAALAARAREALLAGDQARVAALMDENFDTRRSIYTLPAWQVEMVEAARACGASAKFAGLGRRHRRHLPGRRGARGGAPPAVGARVADDSSASRRVTLVSSRQVRPRTLGRFKKLSELLQYIGA